MAWDDMTGDDMTALPAQYAFIINIAVQSIDIVDTADLYSEYSKREKYHVREGIALLAMCMYSAMSKKDGGEVSLVDFRHALQALTLKMRMERGCDDPSSP
jgi:hypothetical protein